MNLVQGHAIMNDVKMESPSDDKNNNTTLTIVQEFPKKRNDNIAGNIEMLQGQEQNTNVHLLDSNKKQKHTTLTIVQDFPKKKASDSQVANNIEMVQGKNT